MRATRENAIFALQIALIHLVYNVLGVIVIYGLLTLLRNIPVIAAEKMAELAVEKNLYVAIYISSLFFLLPIALISISENFGV